MTSLHFAAIRENVDIVQLLLDHGADVSAQDEVSVGVGCSVYIRSVFGGFALYVHVPLINAVLLLYETCGSVIRL